MDLKEILSSPEQIKNLITVLQSLLPEDKSEEIKPSKKKNTRKSKAPTDNRDNINNKHFNKNIKTKNKKSINAASTNKFEAMNEFNMHKEDLEVDKKLAKQPPVARTREFEPISVICRICGKQETVSPSLVHEGPARYKCNNCATQAG